MKTKSKLQVLALAFAVLIFASCLVTVTLGKYVADKDLKWNDDTYLDFTVNSVFVVNSQDELFEAINQGYTYVQLDKSIENPLIVTQKAENLHQDLILDLNGIEIQRNGQDPILNIGEGVRLTVVDTSTEQTGGLYNPVGSVFNINGGTLTVVTGSFESGPRYSEYYSYNSEVLLHDGITKRTVVESDAQPVEFKKKVAGSDSFVMDSTVSTAPIIKSYPTKSGEIEYNHGNLYFDQTVQKGDVTIYPDTYCYYRTSENGSMSSAEKSMADWYYTYYVKESDYSYAFATLSSLPAGASASDYVQITIYGYEDVTADASLKTKPEDYYAAIQMSDGVLDVQDGKFFQYFGSEKTACVNSSGGEINVKQGTFSSRVPDATEFSAHAVAAKESDKLAFDGTYFKNFKWYETDTATDFTSGEHVGNLAHAGESYCILNHGNAEVNIGTCSLSSSNNNIISMKGGKLTIGGGTFSKVLTNGLQTGTPSTQLSAINVENGALEISGANCKVVGDGSFGIIMKDGSLAVSNSSFTVSGGENTTGIYSTIGSSGSFTVTDTDFAVTGTNANGIYSQNGKVQVTSTSGSHKIAVEGENAIGINVEVGGSVVSNGYLYNIQGTAAKGIYATETASGISIDGGAVTVLGDGTFGIQSKISGTNNFTVKNFAVTMSNGKKQTGIYSANGTVSVEATSSATIIVSGDNGKGIHVGANGNVVSKNYEYKLSGTNSYGIFSEAGTVQMNGGKIEVESGVSSYGVYAVSQQQLTMDINGTEISVGYNDTVDAKIGDKVHASIGVFLSSADESSGIKLTNVNVKSLEVGVAANGGPITMCGNGSIETRYASAIAIRGGNLTFENGSEYTLTSYNTTSDDSKNTYDLTVPVFEKNTSGVYELQHVDYRNTDGIYVNGGQFSSYGDLTVTHTGLRNATSDAYYYTYSSLAVTSYALRVLGGNVTINKGKFTAIVGGGIYSGTTTLNGEKKSGNVTLGNETSAVNDVTVETNGTLAGDYYYALGSNINVGSWQSYESITGGHAVEVEGGDITVYNGKYTAQFGNGILANGDGKIDIYDGEFYGYMNMNGTGIKDKSGPSAFYGLKVIGGAKVQIFDGIFIGGNGGAFVTGVTKVNGQTIDKSSTAKVLIYAGTFGDTSGIDAFNVYDDAIVVFGAHDKNHFSGATAATISSSIIMNTKSTANATIAVNAITQNASSRVASTIYVYYGIYNGYFYLDTNCNSTYYTYNYNSAVGYVKYNDTSGSAIKGNQNNTDPEFNSFTIDKLTK